MKAQDWAIRKCAEACSLCGEAFDDRQPFYSLLTFGEEGYCRTDCCEPCWSRADRDAALSTWRGVFRAPPPPDEGPVKHETAESLLRQYIEVEDPSHVRVIFILAVMLERKRILKERDVQQREDGMLVRVYEHARTGEVFMIPDPQLKLSEVDAVRDEVLALLGSSPTSDNRTPSQRSGQKNRAKDEGVSLP